MRQQAERPAASVNEWGECDHNMDPMWCHLCKHPPTRPGPRTYTAAGMAFAAVRDGQCHACRLGVYVGQPIVRTTRNVYVHEACLS